MSPVRFKMKDNHTNAEYDISKRLILALNSGFLHGKHFNCNLNLEESSFPVLCVWTLNAELKMSIKGWSYHVYS